MYHDNDRLLPSDVYTTKCPISKTACRNCEHSHDDDDDGDDGDDGDDCDDDDDDDDSDRPARRLVRIVSVLVISVVLSSLAKYFHQDIKIFRCSHIQLKIHFGTFAEIYIYTLQRCVVFMENVLSILRFLLSSSS